MTERKSAAVATLAQWLAGRSDAQLTQLLLLRPDLTVPVPASMSVLAARAEQRSSIIRAADEFDTLTLSVLDALLILSNDAVDQPLTRKRLYEFFGGRADRSLVEQALERLIATALVRGQDRLALSAGAAAALPWPIGASHTGEEDEGELDEDQITTALSTLREQERALLLRLASTAPIGRTRDAAPDTPADRPIPRLLAAGLLRRLDEQTVELPAAVGRRLRGEAAPDPRSLTPPALNSVERALVDVDGAAAGEALEMLRHCGELIDMLGEAPAPALRAGGLGVRELRRLAKQAGISEERAGMLVELLAAAGLIARGRPDSLRAGATEIDDEFWAPTIAVDSWSDGTPAQRWTTLASTWLDLPRQPWLIGMRDAADKPVAALSDEVRNAFAVRDRRCVLALLAELEPGRAAESAAVAELLLWRRPRWAGRFRGGAATRTLTEATSLGIIGRGALSTPGRALLAGDREQAESAMTAALPKPVDYVLVQADLTLVAPGPLIPDLQHRISQVADLESAGGAAVYRIGTDSVRRALDSGQTAAALHQLFADHSRTPIPQSLTYLIDDVARKHGRLRAGVASSFLRCDDPAQLAEVLASKVAESLALRGIAPTVAVSQAPLVEILTQLRAAGFTPSGEDSTGAIVDLHTRSARILGKRIRPTPRIPTALSDDALARIVVELRAGEDAATARGQVGARTNGTRESSAATLALLQLAARVHRSVTISSVDAQGIAAARIVEPITVGAGQLEALDKATGELRRIPLHRIASVTLVD